MTEAVGRPVAEVEALFRDVHALLTEGREAADPARDFGKLEVLSGVKEFPRGPCATLARHTLHNALVGEHETATPNKTSGAHHGRPLRRNRFPRAAARLRGAVSVPWGKAETLPEGSYALVTQRLGGSITGCAGATSTASTSATPTRSASSRSCRQPAGRRGRRADRRARRTGGVGATRNLLRPEIPIDIVNLGLVYACTAEPLADSRFHRSGDDPHGARLRHGTPDRRRGRATSCCRFPASPMPRSPWSGTAVEPRDDERGPRLEMGMF